MSEEIEASAEPQEEQKKAPPVEEVKKETKPQEESTEEKKEKWGIAQSLGEEAKATYQGKSVDVYLKEFDKVRERTLELFKGKDDAWLAEVQNGMNNHWAWYHVMEHQSSHLGQILLMTKRYTN